MKASCDPEHWALFEQRKQILRREIFSGQTSNHVLEPRTEKEGKDILAESFMPGHKDKKFALQIFNLQPA